MRPESDTPLDERYLMILGRLSRKMVKGIEEQHIREHHTRLKKKGLLTPHLEELFQKFNSRDRSLDCAVFSIHAYANIPLGREYNLIWNRNNPENSIQLRCRLEHILFNAWYPVAEIQHGHKHVLFLTIDDTEIDCFPIFDTWEELTSSDWNYALSDSLGLQNTAEQAGHPNPTALVGNWLTGRRKVVEVVKMR